MPAGIMPDEGIGTILDYILRTPISGVLAWELMLWSGATVPDAATVLADLVESTWTGYHRLTLDRSLWTVPDITDGCAESTWGTDPYAWYVGSGPTEEVCGWAMVDVLGGELRFVQRLDTVDIVTVSAGAVYSLLPRYTLTSRECGSMLAHRAKLLKRPRGTRV